VDVTLIKNAEWFVEVACSAPFSGSILNCCVALASAVKGNCDVNGEKKAMAGHLRRCTHLTAAENALAAEVHPTKAQQKATASEAAKKNCITILGIKP
jgi:hypothetical protein